MPIFPSDYRPKWWLRNGHTNTLYTYFYRKLSKPEYVRERWDTADGDFIDLDFVRGNHKRIVILSHGLEGGSDSQYMIALSNLMSENAYDVCALNYRSCSGEMNRTQTMYHSGFTDDLHLIVNGLADQYEEIFLVGYSLGGNMNLKYTTDNIYPIHPKIKAVTSVLQFLDNVNLPTLLISSEDDPFLTKSCIPTEIAKSHKDIYLLATKYGGHVGFTTFDTDYYWIDYKILDFIESISQI